MPQTSLQLEFADGEYTFALRLPQLAELQDKRGVGIFALYGRVLAGRANIDGMVVASPKHGQAYAEDLLDTIRLALIGGGEGMVDEQPVQVSAARAKQLVDRYCYPAAPLREAWALAAAILSALVKGYDPPKAAPAEVPEPEARAEPDQTVST